MQKLEVCKSCRSRQELSNEYLVFTILSTYYLEKSASIQPTTSLSKFEGDFVDLFIRLLILRCLLLSTLFRVALLATCDQRSVKEEGGVNQSQ